MLSKKVRFRPDYLNIISRSGLTQDFFNYCDRHYGLSEKRQARAFCQKHNLLKDYFSRMRRVLNIPYDGLCDIWHQYEIED